jgi:endonuclease/exonuclease/phosphatase family metal-dependent hydrolase
MSIRVLTYNIHKGFSGGIPKYTLDQMREAIRRIQPDLLFLQEIHGEHNGHRNRIKDYPAGSQFEYLAEEMWPHFSYGKNVVYSQGHHGNAILSKYPIRSWENVDISQNRIERRGILHAVIDVPGVTEPIHAFCAHFGLLEWHRKKQLDQLAFRIELLVPQTEKIIAAGDFNDWRKIASTPLEKRLGLDEAFTQLTGVHASTFPSWFPILCLDRIYFRGFRAAETQKLDDPTWISLSDHIALSATLECI